MAVLEIKSPSEYELERLMDEVDESASWMFRERVPYVDDPEFKEHVFEDNVEAKQFIFDVTFNPQVASRIVYVEVSGESFDEDMFEDLSSEGTLLNVSKKTEQVLLEEKPADMDLDAYLQSLVSD